MSFSCSLRYHIRTLIKDPLIYISYTAHLSSLSSVRRVLKYLLHISDPWWQVIELYSRRVQAVQHILASAESTRKQSSFPTRVVPTCLSIRKLLIKCELTQLCLSADISNLHAWRMHFIALSTNKVIWTSEYLSTHPLACGRINSNQLCRVQFHF